LVKNLFLVFFFFHTSFLPLPFFLLQDSICIQISSGELIATISIITIQFTLNKVPYFQRGHIHFLAAAAGLERYCCICASPEALLRLYHIHEVIIINPEFFALKTIIAYGYHTPGVSCSSSVYHRRAHVDCSHSVHFVIFFVCVYAWWRPAYAAATNCCCCCCCHVLLYILSMCVVYH